MRGHPPHPRTKDRQPRPRRGSGAAPAASMEAAVPRPAGLHARLAAARANALHPMAYGTVLLILVAVGRAPELVPWLAPLQPGNVAVVLAVLALMFGRRLSVPVLATPMGRLMMAFCALATASVAFSVWGSHSLQVLVSGFAAAVLLFYLAAKSAGSPANFHLYLGSLMAAAVMLAVGALLLKTDARAELTTMYDPNDLALVLVTCLPLAAVWVFATAHVKSRWWYLGLTMLLTVGVLATGSRGGFLGLMAVTGFLLFKEMPSNGRFRFATKILVLLVVAAIALSLTHEMVWQRLATLANLENDYNIASDRGRLAIWGRALQTIAERPWGVGLAAFSAAEGMGGGNYQEAHNALIQIGAELGILGVLVYLGFYWHAFRSLSKGYRSEPQPADPQVLAQRQELTVYALALRAALVGFFVTSFFLSKAYSPLFFLLLGLSVATSLRQQALDAPLPEHPRKGK